MFRRRPLPFALLFFALATGFGLWVAYADSPPSLPPETVGTRAAVAQAETSVPAVFVFNPAAAPAAVADFDRTFAEARAAFLRTAAGRFGPLPLPSDTVASEEFAAFARDWGTGWHGFPAKPAVASAWARHQDAAPLLRPLRDRLSQVMTERRIRESVLRPEALVGPAEVQLVTLDAGGTAPPRTFRRPQFYIPAQARQEVRAGWPREDWAAAQFVADLVRPNTFFDPELTQSARDTAQRPAPSPEPVRPPSIVEGAGPPHPTAGAGSPTELMNWILLGFVPAVLCGIALVVAAAVSRPSDEPAGPEFPRLASLEMRMSRLEPQLRGHIAALETRIRQLEDRLPAAKQEQRAALRRELFQVRRQRDGELARLGLSRN